MNEVRFDVVGLGNAIVDVLSHASEAFIEQQGLVKGGMALIDETRAEALYAQMGQATECSGGSVANTLAGMASLGAKTAFIGKVRNDQLGSIFTHDMRATGVHFDTQAATSGPATARCLVMVTPDAQRTMATFIGACVQVSERDVDERLIAFSAMTYIEGYLWDTPEAKAAIRKAIAVARGAGRQIAMTLSDTFCVERHREEFLRMIRSDVDVLFANESEMKSLLKTDDYEAALASLHGLCPIAAVTRGEKGSAVLTAQGIEIAHAQYTNGIVDTTGAGDLYASGFLYGLTRGWDLLSCATLGNRCASEIIQQMGARSARPLRALLAA